MGDSGNGLHRLVNQAIDFCAKSADNLDANGVAKTTKTTTTMMMMISKLGSGSSSALHRPSMDRSIQYPVSRSSQLTVEEPSVVVAF
ncbi:GM15699 [Drosophila sechellia]|uniref:GD23970 n=2 Tax=melanogaster subgroup TaxID=32351 RepID=B4Q5V2_DROSI|nr:GM15699 [Drosophila sechellia]EDX05055.1 GD23970 [Drosophila simulans]